MTIYDFSVKRMNGETQSLADYKDKVLLIVNTASHCGLAPQFTGLEELHQKYHDKGLVVLGFPCGQFADQEEATDEGIIGICKENYGVTFDMFAKIDVNGKHADPLFTYLKKEQGGMLGNSIKWNFTKFLVNREGAVVKRYAPTDVPEKMEADIEGLLDHQGVLEL